MIHDDVCASCRFYSGSDHEGFCLRYAPKPIILPKKLLEPDYYAKFPMVNSQDWCGEYKGVRHHSEEHRRKISESNKGRIHSKETREKLSKAMKGKIISYETAEKMSKARIQYLARKKAAQQPQKDEKGGEK